MNKERKGKERNWIFKSHVNNHDKGLEKQGTASFHHNYSSDSLHRPASLPQQCPRLLGIVVFIHTYNNINLEGLYVIQETLISIIKRSVKDRNKGGIQRGGLLTEPSNLTGQHMLRGPAGTPSALPGPPQDKDPEGREEEKLPGTPRCTPAPCSCYCLQT